MAKKTLAEQLAQLTTPQNDFDIEDSEIKENVFQDEDEDAEESDDETLKSQHYVELPKSKLRSKTDSIQVGSKYTGNVTSRNDLYASDSNNELNNESSEEEEEEEVEQAEDTGSDSGASLRTNSSDDSETDETSDDESVPVDDSHRNAELEHKRQRVKELMSKERTHIVNRLSSSATNDALKGFGISKQHNFFDKIIDSRLKVQKSLTNSNLLPPNKHIMDTEKLSTKNTSKQLSRAKEECYGLLDQLFALRDKLLKTDQISEPMKVNPKKRSLEEYSSITSKFDQHLNKYRSNVLTKWSTRVLNSSGANAINAGKFKAINQSFEQQVINNLSDMDRLIKRTKLNRRQIKPLGYDVYISQSKKDSEESEEDEENINPDIPKEEKNSGNNIAEINEIFDDEDFYRVLLNDLVDKKIQSSNPTSGLTVSLRSAQQAQKFKKNVDTKASKGRKLRYHVQEPIANFETSRGSLKWDDAQIDEFFASLLGQKVNMNETDDEADEDEEELHVGEDTIKLFG